MVSISILWPSPLPLAHTLSRALFSSPSCWARRRLKQCSFLTNPDFEDFASAGQAEKAAAATTQFRRFCGANQETNDSSNSCSRSSDNSSDSNTDAMTDHDQANSSSSRGCNRDCDSSRDTSKKCEEKKRKPKRQLNLVVVVVVDVNKSLVWLRCHLGKAYHICVCVCVCFVCMQIHAYSSITWNTENCFSWMNYSGRRAILGKQVQSASDHASNLHSLFSSVPLFVVVIIAILIVVAWLCLQAF